MGENRPDDPRQREINTVERCEGSVTQRLRQIQNGERGDAHQDVFVRYYRRVAQDARRWIRNSVVDEDDVAASVWESVFNGLQEGKYYCEDRKQFEHLLGRITKCKAINLYNWVTRLKRHPFTKRQHSEAVEFCDLDENDRRVAELIYTKGNDIAEAAETLGMELTDAKKRYARIRKRIQKRSHLPARQLQTEAEYEPAYNVQPYEVLILQELIESLDPSLRDTVLLKLEGCSNQDIARRFKVSIRQIQRRLEVIRRLWSG